MVVTSLDAFDFLISFVYIGLAYVIAYLIKSNNSQKPSFQYFIPFLSFKIFCAIVFVIIYVYFYRGGDTFLYFAGGKFIGRQMLNNPENFFGYLTASAEFFRSSTYSVDYPVVYAFADEATLIMSKITAIPCLMTGNSFLASTILFSIVSSVGMWLLYLSIYQLYPQLYKALAWGILFIPSVGIWGSGILKDPIAYSCLGWIIWSSLRLVRLQKPISNTIIIIIAIYACQVLKPYILYIFFPTLFLWLQGRLSSRISSQLFRYIVTPVIIISFFAGGFFLVQTVSQNAGKYSLENVEQVAEGFQAWHTYLAETRNQSGYSLGEIEFSATGVITKAPEAFFVTFFRPLPWEIRNGVMLMGGIESFLYLLLTIFIILRRGPVKIIRTIMSNREIRFCILFSVILGVAVGITSYNFGALSRYKIPCLPFYSVALILIYYSDRIKTFGKQKLQPRQVQPRPRRAAY